MKVKISNFNFSMTEIQFDDTQDYRFMPEPNLPPLNLASIDMDAMQTSIPEMPDLTRDALSSYNLRQQEIEIMVVSSELQIGQITRN